jgi:predicted ribosomally synthesized peptide with SipW-like signal peptide
MNNNQKATKRALLTSVMALVMCVVMLVGTTFAWFTDTASTAVNKIVAGNLDVDIVDENNNSLDGGSLSFIKAGAGTDAEAAILWEPGATFFTQGFKIVNKGNLALKYKVVVSGTTGDAKLLKAIDFAFVTDNTTPDADPESFANEGKLLKQNDSAPANNGVYYLRGHMKEEAGNEYKNLTLDGISITVYATQYTHEFDSFDNTYDEDAGKDTAIYTLADFNALTKIPDGVKTVYVDLGGKSLQNGLTIGNADIADHYHYGEWDSDVAPAGYPHKTSIDNYTTHDGDKVRYIYSTGKPSVNVILTGSVLGASDTGDFNAGAITLQVPDAANVVFDKVTFGAGQMAMSMWTESRVQSMTVAHRVASVTFDGCTFNGNWIQNGASGADEMVIKNSTFNIHENVGYKNNSNPVWIQNMGQCNVTIEGCTVNAVRPIKLWEGNASGTVTIKNNKFNMSNFADATGDDAYKNVAIMFCGTTEQVKLGNVEITGNTVTGDATGFICFYNNSTQYPFMNTDATFKLSGNTLNGVKESVLWKTATEWKPDYVNR